MTAPHSRASVPPPGLPGLTPAHSRIVAAAGAEWHLLDTGPALEAAGVAPVGTLLCVHGNPTWSYLWRALVAESVEAATIDPGRAWRVIAVDQLEMGFSERTGRVRRLADRVADLGALTDTLGLGGPVVTVGHDWGGPVSLGWAVDHPELLAGVVLLNTAVHNPGGRPIPAPLRAALAPGVLGVATEKTSAFLDTTLSLARPGLASDVRAAFRSPYASSGRRAGIRDFVADIPVDASHPSFAELGRIAAGVAALRVPALILWGPQDPVFRETYLRDLLERMPQAHVHRFEGAGHLIAEEIGYAPIVLDWLGERTARPVADSSGSHRSEGAAGEWSSEPLWASIEANEGSDAPALIDMGAGPEGSARIVSWSLLARRVDELAHGLVAAGVRPGDRIGLLVPPSADLTAVLYAAVRIGTVVVVADAGLGVRGLGRAIRGAHTDVIVGALPGLAAARALGWPGRRISVPTLSPALARSLGVEHSLGDLLRLGRERVAVSSGGAPLPAPAPSDLAAVLFTSGSTGPAKGVRYTHAQLSALRDALAAQYDVGPGAGIVAGFAPFALLGPALGARSVIPVGDVTAPRTLTASAVADAARSADATVLFLSPAALANVVATADALDAGQREALAHIGTVLSAGAPVPARLLERIVALMPQATAHTPYGMTEGLLMTDITLDGIRAADDADAAGPGGVCVGRPVAGVTVAISPLDADGRPTAVLTTEPGISGEIVVEAPHLRDGYDRLWAVDRVARAHSAGPGARRHSTGDVGHLDAEGRLWVEGRLQHVLVTPEGVVTPVGAEQAIEAVPGVRRAALVGVGPRGVQALVAVVETEARARPGLADASLARAVRDASPHPLAAVLTVATLPTDIRHNSKIDRTALAAWADSVLRGERAHRP
ncbi:alpha/beta fold hydrolase [Leifsonia sp. fls2-241-R2A-40a]|uniref:alpha/beta fold hydrolase n=1 Tax=Leifsonia sp. fls2-241-R2A-40a TaxID=3040290 RepID=UPI00254E3027|nr:alpha/beta fold hydrolase [Leifsonia sp. fls2-241-R2A-40a]